MPVEGAKEAARIAIETSGSAMSWIGGIFIAVTSSTAAAWKYITSKISRIEQDAKLASVIKSDLDAHIIVEDKKFDAIFTKLHKVGEDVAWIKGKMDQDQ